MFKICSLLKYLTCAFFLNCLYKSLITTTTRYQFLVWNYVLLFFWLNCSVYYILPFRPTPFMGDLPSYRVEPHHPFLFVGMDYEEPIMFKETQRRNSKITQSAVHMHVRKGGTFRGYLRLGVVIVISM